MKLSCNHDGVSELFDENKQDIVLNIYFGRRYGGGWASLLAQRACQVALVVKNPPVDSGDTRDTGSIPGSGRSPGVGNGNPLQYSCQENPMGRGAWWATVHGLAKSQTRPSDKHSTECNYLHPEAVVACKSGIYYFSL